jgi:hypothetical protein
MRFDNPAAHNVDLNYSNHSDFNHSFYRLNQSFITGRRLEALSFDELDPGA